jgi:hypothetical protein
VIFALGRVDAAIADVLTMLAATSVRDVNHAT